MAGRGELRAVQLEERTGDRMKAVSIAFPQDDAGRLAQISTMKDSDMAPLLRPRIQNGRPVVL